MSVAGTKTVTSVSASLFAGASAMVGRVFMRARNMDTCVSCTIAGRTIEPGEYITLSFDSTAQTPETVYAQSNGRALKVEVIEG